MRLIEPSHQIDEPVSESQKSSPETGERAKGSMKGAIKKLLPRFLVQEIQSFRKYKKNERPIYLKLRLLEGIGLGNGKRLQAPATARAFVFVCFGNIMRSPMCEALMRRELPDQSGQVTIISAGLHASQGTMAHPWALAAARELGISLDDHRAQQLTAEMVDQSDAIFAMDCQNQVELLANYPNAKRKIFMLGAYAGDSDRRVEIPDPYYGDPEQTRHCYQVLQRCIHNVASAVLRDLRPKEQ